MCECVLFLHTKTIFFGNNVSSEKDAREIQRNSEKHDWALILSLLHYCILHRAVKTVFSKSELVQNLAMYEPMLTAHLHDLTGCLCALIAHSRFYD